MDLLFQIAQVSTPFNQQHTGIQAQDRRIPQVELIFQLADDLFQCIFDCH